MREDYEKNGKEEELEERRGEKRQKDRRRGKLREERTIRRGEMRIKGSRDEAKEDK